MSSRTFLWNGWLPLTLQSGTRITVLFCQFLWFYQLKKVSVALTNMTCLFIKAFPPHFSMLSTLHHCMNLSHATQQIAVKFSVMLAKMSNEFGQFHSSNYFLCSFTEACPQLVFLSIGVRTISVKRFMLSQFLV